MNGKDSKYEFDLILDEIKEILVIQKCDSRELVSKVSYPEEKVIKVLRWLLDHNKIITDKRNLLSWREPDLFTR